MRIIGEVCELTPITKFFNGNPILGAVTTGTRNFIGRDGAELWERIGTLIDKRWDDVIDAIDEVISMPEVDADAVTVADDELLAAASAVEEDELDDDVVIVDNEDDDEDSDEDDEDDDLEEDDDEDYDEIDEDDFWASSASTRSRSSPPKVSSTRSVAIWATTRSSSARTARFSPSTPSEPWSGTSPTTTSTTSRRSAPSRTSRLLPPMVPSRSTSMKTTSTFCRG